MYLTEVIAQTLQTSLELFSSLCRFPHTFSQRFNKSLTLSKPLQDFVQQQNFQRPLGLCNLGPSNFPTGNIAKDHLSQYRSMARSSIAFLEHCRRRMKFVSWAKEGSIFAMIRLVGSIIVPPLVMVRAFATLW